MWESWLGKGCRSAAVAEQVGPFGLRAGADARCPSLAQIAHRRKAERMTGADAIDGGLMRPVLDGVRVIELAGIGPAPNSWIVAT